MMRNELSGSLRINFAAVDNSCSICPLLPQPNKDIISEIDKIYFIAKPVLI